MRGTIKAYSASVNAGVINGADGNIYSFDKIHWTGADIPQYAEHVSFESEQRHASNVRAFA